MYNDYPTTGYNSNVDQFVFLKIGIAVIVLAIIVFVIISIMRVFKKANRNPISVLIPFYNLIALLEICNLPKMYFIILLIPIVNLVFFYRVYQVLAKLYKKDQLFGLGLLVLPVVYFPILGFGKSEYIGINLAGMDSKNQVSRIEVIDENKNKEIEVEENKDEDVTTRNVDISLGGGKYQKEYATNLDNVEQERIITQRNLKEQQKQQEQQKLEDQRIIYENQKIHVMPVVTPVEQQEPQTETKEVFDINYIQTTEEKEKERKRVEEEKKQQEEARLKEEERQRTQFFACPKCGTKLPNGTQICITCGTKIN